MANVDRIKRQLLRDLVQQNVDLIEGRPSRSRPRRDVLRLALRVAALVQQNVDLIEAPPPRPRPRRAARRLALRAPPPALLPAALFGPSRLIPTRGEPRPAVAAARTAKGPAPRPMPARQSGAAPPAA